MMYLSKRLNSLVFPLNNFSIYAVKPAVSAGKCLILLLVEEEIFFAGVVGPDVFDALVDFALIFHLL